MGSDNTLDPSALEDALASAARDLPAYRTIIDFYGALFQVQEAAARGSEPPSADDPPTADRAAGFPLASPAEFEPDPAAFDRCLTAVLNLAAHQGTPELAGAAEALRRGMTEKPVAAAAPGRALLAGDDAETGRLCADMGIEPALFSFLVYAALKPGLRAWAHRLAARLPDDPPWERGCCPVCGSPPVLAVLDEAGNRRLICGFCWQEWPVPRIFCPHCESRKVEDKEYFFSAEESGYRVDVCNGCGSYIKTVDTRGLGRRFYPPLESVLTLHLDMQAQGKGLNGTPCRLAAG